MSKQRELIRPVWTLLEKEYLDLASEGAKTKYAGSSDTVKWTILIEFARRQAVTSKRWAAILRDLPAADRIG
jgi:hypothetical protein